MKRLDQLTFKGKAIVFIIVIIPLFVFIFYDMASNMKNGGEEYYKCPSGKIVELNQSFQKICFENYVYIKYENKIVSYQEWKRYKHIIKNINKSLSNLPD